MLDIRVWHLYSQISECMFTIDKLLLCKGYHTNKQRGRRNKKIATILCPPVSCLAHGLHVEVLHAVVMPSNVTWTLYNCLMLFPNRHTRLATYNTRMCIWCQQGNRPTCSEYDFMLEYNPPHLEHDAVLPAVKIKISLPYNVLNWRTD